MVKFTGDQADLLFGLFRKRIPEIVKYDFFTVTEQEVDQEIYPVRKKIKYPEGCDPEEEYKGPEEKIGQEFHAVKLVIWYWVLGIWYWVLNFFSSKCTF